jgi:maltooligosyltrehalose trehalohydrolase
VWAPEHQAVEVVIEGLESYDLTPEPNGYFAGVVESVASGCLYRFRIDREGSYPDPASRFQPEGPDGPSQVVDSESFLWTDDAWPGVHLEGQVIYEMHIGTFTPEGSWLSASRELPKLQAAGFTLLEIMPVGDFAGSFGWGYDGVNLFAPTRLYGQPDDFRHFVNQAHSCNMGVILDVVYNHLGPQGNYLKQFSKDYFTDRYATDWGEAINYDGEGSAAVREFFLANAGYWIDEYHLDGLRLDATQDIYDRSSHHILAAITKRAREAAKGRSIVLVAENEPQHVKLVMKPDQGGYGMDALWNDDFHHSAMVALTGRKEAYYTDYLGSPQEFISAIKWGYLYQGQWYKWQKKRRGTPALGLKPAAFVTFIQNHDQVANSAGGRRCHELTSPGKHRAMTALMLLAPGTPMIFQGQEFAASSPFLYFADLKGELANLTRQGRAEFLAQFRSIATPEMEDQLHDPSDPATFRKSQLDLGERESHAAIYALHCDLLRLRREDAVFHVQRPRGVDGAVLGSEAFVLRFFGENTDDRLLLVNFGSDLNLNPAPEPLLAPPEGYSWRILWSSEDPRYGGSGTPPLESDENWHIPGQATIALCPEKVTEP